MLKANGKSVSAVFDSSVKYSSLEHDGLMELDKIRREISLNVKLPFHKMIFSITGTTVRDVCFDYQLWITLMIFVLILVPGHKLPTTANAALTICASMVTFILGR